MGKTFRRGESKTFDDDRQLHRKGKPTNHANGRKTGGMKVINQPFNDLDEDYFDDDVGIADRIVINKYSETSR